MKLVIPLLLLAALAGCAPKKPAANATPKPPLTFSQVPPCITLPEADRKPAPAEGFNCIP